MSRRLHGYHKRDVPSRLTRPLYPLAALLPSSSLIHHTHQLNFQSLAFASLYKDISTNLIRQLQKIFHLSQFCIFHLDFVCLFDVRGVAAQGCVDLMNQRLLPGTCNLLCGWLRKGTASVTVNSLVQTMACRVTHVRK